MIASPEPTSQAFLPEIEPETPQTTRLIPGTDRAREISQLGIKARQAKKEQAKLALSNPVETGEEHFKTRRLARVRKQLDKLQDAYDEALAGTLYVFDKTGLAVQVFDPSHLDRIAAAIARMAELERQLSDWALPGSKRPAVERKSRGPSLTVCAEDVD